MSEPHRHNGESVLGCPTCDPTGALIEERLAARRHHRREQAMNEELRAALDAAERMYRAVGAVTAGDKSVSEYYLLAYAELGDRLSEARAALSQPRQEDGLDWRALIAAYEPWIGWDSIFCYWCDASEGEEHQPDCTYRLAAEGSDERR